MILNTVVKIEPDYYLHDDDYTHAVMFQGGRATVLCSGLNYKDTNELVRHGMFGFSESETGNIKYKEKKNRKGLVTCPECQKIIKSFKEFRI